jgi:hypothetical protein
MNHPMKQNRSQDESSIVFASCGTVALYGPFYFLFFFADHPQNKKRKKKKEP